MGRKQRMFAMQGHKKRDAANLVTIALATLGWGFAALGSIRYRRANAEIAEAKRALEEANQRRARAQELARLLFHASILADRHHAAQVENTRLLELQEGAQQVRSTGNLHV